MPWKKCGADIENLRKNLNEYFNEYIKTTENTGIQESLQFSASDINSRGTVYSFW